MTGAEVETAENGKIAVEKVEASPEGLYDLVFMDIQMPVMNGYEATAAIRSLPGEKGKLPIVAMTANAFAEDVQLAKNTGMNGHIAKPIDMDKVISTLSRVLTFKCPVCGKYTFQSGPGSYEICPVCGWEDDKAQYKDPNLKGGANRLSLKEYKKQYEKNHE